MTTLVPLAPYLIFVRDLSFTDDMEEGKGKQKLDTMETKILFSPLLLVSALCSNIVKQQQQRDIALHCFILRNLVERQRRKFSLFYSAVMCVVWLIQLFLKIHNCEIIIRQEILPFYSLHCWLLLCCMCEIVVYRSTYFDDNRRK
jgi:hypothetical protein